MPEEKDQDGYFDNPDAGGLTGYQTAFCSYQESTKESGSSLQNIQMHLQVPQQPGSHHKHHYTDPYPSVVADHRSLPDRDH